MKNLKILNNKKLGALLLAGFMLVGAPKVAKADTATANKVLDDNQIIYQQADSVATNLVVNAQDVLMTVSKDGVVPEEYKDTIMEPTLVLGDVNQMRENILNYNVIQLFENPENFNYLSMGIYMDNEQEKQILDGVASLVDTFAKTKSEETLQKLLGVFVGHDQELSTNLLSVGGKQVLANDIYFIQALVEVYDMEDYKESINAIANSYGENADIITYINAIANKKCR